MTARSKAWVCGCLFAGIAGSNLAGGMVVCRKCCVLSGRGLCDRPITHPEESCQLCVSLSVMWLKENFSSGWQTFTGRSHLCLYCTHRDMVQVGNSGGSVGIANKLGAGHLEESRFGARQRSESVRPRLQPTNPLFNGYWEGDGIRRG